jgi:hypothetical protein
LKKNPKGTITTRETRVLFLVEEIGTDVNHSKRVLLFLCLKT